MLDFLYWAAWRRKIIANYVTSELDHQCARKALFTCVVHANSEFSLDKFRFSQEHSFVCQLQLRLFKIHCIGCEF